MNLAQVWMTIKQLFVTPPTKKVQVRLQMNQPTVKKKKTEKEKNNAAYLLIPNSNRRLPLTSSATLTEFINTHKSIIDKFIFFNLRDAIKNNAHEVILFSIAGTNLITKIEKKNFVETLKTLEENFLKEQEYEFIEPVRKLISKHYINLIIE